MKLSTSQIDNITNRANQIKNFAEREDFVIEHSQDHLRICCQCGKIIGEGYIIHSAENYCSDKCLRQAIYDKRIEENIFETLSHADDNDFDENYWTVWNE